MCPEMSPCMVRSRYRRSALSPPAVWTRRTSRLAWPLASAPRRSPPAAPSTSNRRQTCLSPPRRASTCCRWPRGAASRATSPPACCSSRRTSTAQIRLLETATSHETSRPISSATGRRATSAATRGARTTRSRRAASRPRPATSPRAPQCRGWSSSPRRPAASSAPTAPMSSARATTSRSRASEYQRGRPVHAAVQVNQLSVDEKHVGGANSERDATCVICRFSGCVGCGAEPRGLVHRDA
mmetsp:Transcript_40883/g.112408  ORF Transcript_40883/g.112408 Transcript_40883/m.112408 type:complete len:241 (-) Transcript_40883:110-832(-)